MSEHAIVGRLDPRSLLAFQASFAIAAYAHTEPLPLAGLAVLAMGVVRVAGGRPLRMLVELRYLVVFLALAPVIASIQIGSPWMDLSRGYASGLAAIRVLLIVLVSLAIVRLVDPRAAQAAITWLVPGRFGRMLGTSVGLVMRMLPLLRTEAAATQRAMRARGGDRRSAIQRTEILAIALLVRTFQRVDRMAAALRARCLSWNQTLAPLQCSRYDAAVVTGAIGLLVWAIW